MSLTYINYIRRNIRLDHEKRILVSTYIQAFALPYRIELRSVVLSDNLSVRIVLVSGLLDMFATAAIRLRLKADIIFHRLRKLHQHFIGESGNFLKIKRA